MEASPAKPSATVLIRLENALLKGRIDEVGKALQDTPELAHYDCEHGLNPVLIAVAKGHVDVGGSFYLFRSCYLRRWPVLMQYARRHRQLAC